MSAPQIISTSPSNGTRDVVLGTSITVGFDQVLDTTTVNSSTFSLTGPGQTGIVTPGSLIAKTPSVATGREYIEGSFSFSDPTAGPTTVVFTPSVPLRPNVTYTLVAIGQGSLVTKSIKNLAGESLAHNYQWTFTTGDLPLTVPPPTFPLPQLSFPLNPALVQTEQQVFTTGNDLSQQIDIVFPADIDLSSVSPEQIKASLEPILNDPSVVIPPNLQTSVAINGNKITILISGWPLSS